MQRRVAAPVWLVGLTNSAFGIYSGIIVVAIPTLLGAHEMSEAYIASMTAVVVSAGFWTLLFSPLLDVKFSRRSYAIVTALAAALMLMLALVNLNHPVWVEVLLTAGYFFINLYQSALGGWLASIVPSAARNRLSAWVTIGNIAGGGLMALISEPVARELSPSGAALFFGTMVLVPLLVFPWMRERTATSDEAREGSSHLLQNLLGMLKRPAVLIALALFVLPSSTFTLTNLLSGLGNDYHASEHFAGLIGGAGVVLGGTCGCLVFPLVARLMPLRPLYLAVGVLGSLFTLGLLWLPLSPSTFALAVIGENVFQGLAISASVAISFQTIGARNPLAASTYCLLVTAFNVPITYMLFVDGSAYARHGVFGSFTIDASLDLLSCALLAVILLWYSRRSASSKEAPS